MHYIKILLIFLSFSVLVVGCYEDYSSKSTTQLLESAEKAAAAGNWKKTQSYAKAILKRDPRNVSALLLAALVQEKSGNPDQAEQLALDAVKADPANFFAQYTLGRLYAKDPEKVQDSIEPLLRALRFDARDVNTLVLLAESAKKLGMPSAIEYYKKLAATSRYRGRPEPWNELGLIYIDRKEYKSAANCLVEAYRLGPDNHYVVYNFAVFCDRYVGNPERAVKFYKRYLEIIANNPELKTERLAIEKRIREISE